MGCLLIWQHCLWFSFFGGGAKGWQLTFMVFATIAVVLYIVTYKFTKERVGVGVGEEA